MSEEDLNKKYIRDNLEGICQDCIHFKRTIPHILSMIQGAYKSGLVQAEIDNTMGVIEENERLHNIIKEVREYILQNCEIIRFENEGVDKVGKVEGIPILEILDKEKE